MKMTQTERDRLFVDKCYQYIADPAFEPNVENYLETMVQEYFEQQDHWAERGDVGRARDALSKREAYADALRVLQDAIKAALDLSMETPR